MKEKEKQIFYSFLAIILWITLYFVSNALLEKLNLSFRLWIHYLYLIVIAGLIVILSLSLIIFFTKLYSNNYKDLSRKITMKVVSVVSITIVIGLAMFGLFMTLLGVSAISTSKEYVITRDNVKMLAFADGATNSYVGYYDYKNFILRGSQIRISETYAEPISTFDLNAKVSVPIRTTYYDKDGNISKEE